MAYHRAVPERPIESRIRVSLDTQEMRAALSRLEADFRARAEGMVGSVDKLAEATNALSSKMGDGFNRLGGGHVEGD